MTPPVPVRKFVADAAERVAWTFVETFAGALALTAVTGSLSLSTAHAATIAAAAATLTVVKTLAASRLGSAGTASTLPAELAPAPLDRERQVTRQRPLLAIDGTVETGSWRPTPPPLVDLARPVVWTTPPPSATTPMQLVRDGLDQPIESAPPAPGTSSPPVEALGHVDPPEVPPAPSPAAKARHARAQAAEEAKAAKKQPAKKAAPAKQPAKKASSTRKRSR